MQRETTGIRSFNMQGDCFKMSPRANVYALPLRLMPALQQHSSSINLNEQQANAATAMPTDAADAKHQRLGHCNMRIVEKAATIGDNGVSIKRPVITGRCSTRSCHLGKSAQIAHPKPDTPH